MVLNLGEKVISEHIAITTLVVSLTHFLGKLIAKVGLGTQCCLFHRKVFGSAF